MPLIKKHFGFAAAMILAVTGCGDKSSSHGVSQGNSSSAKTSAPAESGPMPTPDEQDANERAITFIRTRVGQKDWASARQSLQSLESRPMTPAQREAVNQLKTQIPSP
jgi:hypothetical protein